MNRDQVAKHYSRGELLLRLRAALQDDGADPDHPTMDALAPYDQFHGRGVEATRDALGLMPARANDRILDIGSGLGGPARSVADRFGCTVTGIDLMPEFCEVARELSRLLNFEKRTVFEVADATSMPFEAGSFDGAYSMNVSMNIGAKAIFYQEVHRVLKPGAWLVLSEIARGEGPEVDYPTAWAASSDTSFLCTTDETVLGLNAAGFEIVSVRSTSGRNARIRRPFARIGPARREAASSGGDADPRRERRRSDQKHVTRLCRGTNLARRTCRPSPNITMTKPTATYRELTQSVTQNLASLRSDMPDLMKGFGDMARAATRDGALDKKTKELIALALGVAAHCDACIGFHVQTLVKLGATKAEVEEALGMAVYMGGGPSLMYSANAMAAFDEFSTADAR